MRDVHYFAQKPVESLQTMLRRISNADPRILPVIPNGRYNSNTYASVLSFQEAVGKNITGITNQDTWDSIVLLYDQLLPTQTPPVIMPSWSVGQIVRPGQFNYHIYLVQAMLTALSAQIPIFPKTELTGTLDAQTETGLRLIQKAGGLTETGELNTSTWNYLNNLYRIMIKDGFK